MMETKGPMNGPHKIAEPKHELQIEAHYGPKFDDSEYRSERKERLAQKQKALKSEIKALTAEKALGMVKAGLEKELRRCEMEAMEYEDSSVGDAYDED